MTKIVLIDDELIIRQRLSQLLELDEYQVTAAENGREGLEVIDRESPDIALIDIKMPGMDGIEVLKDLKVRGVDTEVIMITGHGGAETAIEALREGAFSYLQKPVDYDELEIDIKKALGKRKMTQELAKHVKKLETLVDEKSKEIEQRILVEEKLELKRQELHANKTYLDTLIESMADGLLVLNPDGSIRFANKATENILGYDGQWLGQATITSILAEGLCWPDFQELIVNNGSADLECAFLDSQEGEVPVLLSCSVLPDEKGELSGIICVAKDISDLKEAEKKLKENQAKLIHTDRLTSLGEMATGIAHEINQPLTYINTVVQLCIEKCKNQKFNPEKFLPKFERALHQSTRITKIIDHLRSFGRMDESDQRALVNLETVLSNALILMKDKMRLNNVGFSSDIEDELPEIFGLSHEIEQVFINLIQNSVDALEGRENKEITVRMGSKKENFISIDFADNGQGMSKEVVNKLFDPFFTTKDPGVGTGLGMAISFGIVRGCQGEISCESEPGKGTQFSIKLPLDRRDSER
jgi:two-component system NtrC family sensor kinase